MPLEWYFVVLVGRYLSNCCHLF